MSRPDEWTVVTWNVHGRARPRVAALAGVLSELRPDVIALQEVRWWQTHHLALRLGMSRVWNRKHYPFTRALPCLAEGAAILTPHTISAHGAEVVSDVQDTTTYRRRIAQWATVTASSGPPVRVVNIHLSPERLADERRREARRVDDLVRRFDAATDIDRHAGARADRDRTPLADTVTVIAGDLNDHDDGSVIDALPCREYERPAPTNPADRPIQVLDHVLLPDGVEHRSTSVPGGGSRWSALSDHLPVTVRFRLGPTGPERS